MKLVAYKRHGRKSDNGRLIIVDSWLGTFWWKPLRSFYSLKRVCGIPSGWEDSRRRFNGTVYGRLERKLWKIYREQEPLLLERADS